jgi:hypothetical protein
MAISSGARTLALALAVTDAADKVAEYKPAVNAAAPVAMMNLFLRIMICFSKKWYFSMCCFDHFRRRFILNIQEYRFVLSMFKQFYL